MSDKENLTEKKVATKKKTVLEKEAAPQKPVKKEPKAETLEEKTLVSENEVKKTDSETKEAVEKPVETTHKETENQPEASEKNTPVEETETVENSDDALSETKKEETENQPITSEKNTSEEEVETLEKSDETLLGSKKEETAQREVDDANAEESEDEETAKKHEIPMKDYHAMSMEELVAEFSNLLKKEKIQAIKEHVEEIKTEFNAKFDEELEQKKEEFLEDGGNIIDFYYSTPIKKNFNSVYFDYKEKRNAHYKELKQNLNKNLETRLAIIEELKGMIGVGANMNANFNQFKELQERWKKAGPIPRDKYNTVWNNYHHHVEHFYDFLHLDREFRDMDFKHNLDQKLKIIVRAEELAQETNINRAFRELQMLHKMWKEDLGPVEKKYRDEIWEKFSEVTKKIHENRQVHFAELDKKNEKNLEAKQEIIEKIKTLSKEEFASHKQVQQNIKQIEALRNDFFKAGKVPKKDNETIWSAFKEATRNFNRKKNAFYKNLKKDQYDNLEKKKALVKIAEENKESDDFETVTPLMKKIQSDWKKIGHVPRKDSDKIWKQFKTCCNHYFDRMHASKNEENKEETAAFEQKKELLDNLKTLELGKDHKEALATIKSTISDWKNIGRVPNNKRFIEGKFNKALDGLFDKLDMDRKEAELLKYENRIQALDDSHDAEKIEKEQFFLRKKVDETKAEIRQLENNLQFFSNVDDKNPLVKEVHQNIAKHKEQLETWKAKLKKVKAL